MNCDAFRTIRDVTPDEPIFLVLPVARPGRERVLIDGAPVSTLMEPGVIGTTMRELAAALAPLMALEAVKLEMGKLTVQPGEAAVFRSPQTLTIDMVRELQDWWREHMEGVPLLVLAAGQELTTVAKGDAA